MAHIRFIRTTGPCPAGTLLICRGPLVHGTPLSVIALPRLCSCGYQALPPFNDLIHGFCRVFNHVFCKTFESSPRPGSRLWSKENTGAHTNTQSGYKSCCTQEKGPCVAVHHRDVSFHLVTARVITRGQRPAFVLYKGNATYVPSRRGLHIRLPGLECCRVMTRPGENEEKQFGTSGPFKELVVLLVPNRFLSFAASETSHP